MKNLNKIMNLLKENGLSSLLITDPITIDYLTGVLVNPGERLFLLQINEDEKAIMYINELFPAKVPDFIRREVIKDTDDYLSLIAKNINNSKAIGIDKNMLAKFLIPLMEKKEGNYVLASHIPDSLRAIKDEEEREKMKEVSLINDRSMEEIVDLIANGNLGEDEAANELLKIYMKNGAQGFSFPPIIAYGKNGADPHHENDRTKLIEGDSIIVDIGCKLNGYNADMTRTYFYKEVNSVDKKIYEIVKEAQERALRSVRPGMRFKDIDLIARDYISKAGYGDYFTHRLGHGIGREVHEGDDVSSINENILKEGMIFSIEPGIYIPGRMGVRIEDLVLVTKDGYEVLNHVDKSLKVIGK